MSELSGELSLTGCLARVGMYFDRLASMDVAAVETSGEGSTGSV